MREMKKSLWTLLVIAIVFIIVQVFVRMYLFGSPWIGQIISLLYLWSPGFVALGFARKENLILPIFRNLRSGFFWMPVYSFVIVAFAFLAYWIFGSALQMNPIFADRSIGSILTYVILFFFTSYLLGLFLFGILFFGGELYWRGYLWEKLKDMPTMKAIWLTALFWVLWQLPLNFLSYSPGFESVLLNFLLVAFMIFILSPPLLYFRLKYRSILASTFFYGSLTAAFMYLMVIVPTAELRSLALYGIFILLGLVIFSLIFKLYSPSTWEKLKKPIQK